MNKTEKQYKKYMENMFPVNENYNQVMKKIDFNKEENIMKRRNIFAFTSVAMAIVIAGAIGVNAIEPKVSAPKALIKVDVNPSVEMTVDQNNKVVSITGKNDDGIMLLHNEKLTGKKLDDVLNVIIDLESEAGFLLKGEIEATKNTISVSVTGDTSELTNNLKTNIRESITSICDKLNINESINELENYTRTNLENIVVEIDPTLETSVSTLSIDEMLQIIANNQKELSKIYSKELQDLYIKAKNTEISFVEKEAFKNILGEVESTYQHIVSEYKNFVTSLESSKKLIEETKYNLFIKSDSVYQVCLKEVLSLKDEINLLNKVIEDEKTSLADKLLAQIEIGAKTALYETAIVALENAKELANQTLLLAEEALDNIILGLKDLEKNFPDEIKSKLNSKAQDIENKINKAKDSFFKDFEEKYQNDLVSAKADIEARKQALLSK